MTKNSPGRVKEEHRGAGPGRDPGGTKGNQTHCVWEAAACCRQLAAPMWRFGRAAAGPPPEGSDGGTLST